MTLAPAPDVPRRVGAFTLLAALKKGGMGQVYRARHDDGTEVAVKEILGTLDRHSAPFQRFCVEVDALSRLPRHPNVVGFVFADTDAERPYLVMELLVGGMDLSEYMKLHGMLPFDRAAHFILQAAAGLEHIAAHDLVHRDLKPGNLFWVTSGSPHGTVKILDLGVVRLREPGADGLTNTGDTLGTRGYGAPEQWDVEDGAKGAKVADGRADVFGLAATMCALLTGAAPFRDLRNGYDFDRIGLAASRPDLTPAVRAFLRKALKVDPEERHQTARAFREELERLVQPAAGRTVVNGVGMVLVELLPGTFTMGARDDDALAYGPEKPSRLVTLTRSVFVGAHTVTKGQYREVLGLSPVTEEVEHPAERVSWEEAVAFCAALSARPAERAAGRSYRLPTEAEWEYACRAGSDEPFAFGHTLPPGAAHFTEDLQPPPHGTRPVSGFVPNAFGLCGMHGNVWEWCADWYDKAAYRLASGPQTDPAGPASSPANERVIRGGCYLSSPRQCRSAARKGLPPNVARDDTGFRVVAEVRSPSAE